MKTKTINRILLSENQKEIIAANQSATTRAEQLNSIASIFYFESSAEFYSRVKNLERMVYTAILKRPAIKELSKNIELSAIKIPPDIAEGRNTIEALIKKYGDGVFTHLGFVDLAGRWEVDQDQLHAYAESQRVYAETENEIQKYEGAKALCDFLNRLELGFENYAKGEFHNCLIHWDISLNKWEPSIHFIKG